jgi:hypothetical protein
MSDVMHGPSVLDPDDRRRHKTYLLALIDDATRIIPYAAFARSETVAALLPVFERPIRRRGVSKRLYVDNGSAFRSRHLALVCAKLGVTLIHARPFQPQAKGKLERWFRTVRAQLLPTLTDADTRDLEALNRRLWAWIEDEYWGSHCSSRQLLHISRDSWSTGRTAPPCVRIRSSTARASAASSASRSKIHGPSGNGCCDGISPRCAARRRAAALSRAYAAA